MIRTNRDTKRLNRDTKRLNEDTKRLNEDIMRPKTGNNRRAWVINHVRRQKRAQQTRRVSVSLVIALVR